MRYMLTACCLVAALSLLGVANDTFETAIALGTLAVGGELEKTGMSIDTATDADYFSFEIALRVDVTIETTGSLDGDTVMTLYDANRQLIAEDDDGGYAAYSKIEASDLDPGRYYVQVRAYGKTGGIDDYTLSVTAGGLPCPPCDCPSCECPPCIQAPCPPCDCPDCPPCEQPSTGIAPSQDKFDFLQRLALALEQEGWTVKSWPTADRLLAAVEQDNTFVFVLTVMYHSTSLSRLIVHSLFGGDPVVDRYRLEAINQLNRQYNVGKVSVDDDGDIWCETHYLIQGSINPALLSEFLVWFDDALQTFLVKNQEAIGIDM